MDSTLDAATAVARVARIAAGIDPFPEGAATPQIESFLRAAGFGTVHAGSPVETLAFGRLVGLWDAMLEMRARDGSWARR